jgi:hypothetical protein
VVRAVQVAYRLDEPPEAEVRACLDQLAGEDLIA